MLSSFVVAFVGDPWYGIGLAILAASFVPFTLIVFIYTVVLNFFKKEGRFTPILNLKKGQVKTDEVSD